MDKKFLNAADIAEILDISRGHAYKLMRQLNAELAEKTKIGYAKAVYTLNKFSSAYGTGEFANGAISLLGDGTGILVDRNPNEYSDSILNLLHNRELYDYHVSKGLEKSLKHDKSEYMQRLYTLL